MMAKPMRTLLHGEVQDILPYTRPVRQALSAKFNCVNNFLFTFSQLILVDRSERGHYLMELVAEKQKMDLNNNSASDDPSDFVAVLQLEDPQGIVDTV